MIVHTKVIRDHICIYGCFYQFWQLLSKAEDDLRIIFASSSQIGMQYARLLFKVFELLRELAFVEGALRALIASIFWVVLSAPPSLPSSWASLEKQGSKLLVEVPVVSGHVFWRLSSRGRAGGGMSICCRPAVVGSSMIMLELSMLLVELKVAWVGSVYDLSKRWCSGRQIDETCCFTAVEEGFVCGVLLVLLMRILGWKVFCPSEVCELDFSFSPPLGWLATSAASWLLVRESKLSL